VKLIDIDVDGFGVWSGLKVRELSDISVLYGPNEAGKTTLLEFIRSILYGFTPDRRARYFPPLGGGRPGGAIHVLVDHEASTVSRHADGDEDLLEVSAADEDPRLDPHLARALVGEIDEQTFKHVFAFGLREIQELGALTDTKAGQLLYELSLGIDRVSLLEVVREIAASRNRLLASDQRPSLIVQLVGQREQLRGEIAELAELTPRYLALSGQRQLIDAELARVEQDRVAAQARAQLHSVALAISEPWQLRTELDDRLRALGDVQTLPNGAVTRFDEIKAKYRAQQARLKKLKFRRRELLAEDRRLDVNEALCRHAARVEALGEQQPWIEALTTQIRGLEERVAEAELELEAEGQHWAKGAQPQVPSRAKMTMLGEQARALRAATSKLRAFKEAIKDNTLSSDAAGGQIAAHLGQEGSGSVVEDLEKAGELVSKLRRRVQLEERIDKLGRHQQDLEEQTYAWMDRRMLPTGVLVGLGAVFVLGFSLVLSAILIFLPTGIIGGLGWVLAVVGIGGTASAGMTKFFMERSAARQLDLYQNRLTQVTEQLGASQAEMAELDAQLPSGGGALVARLQTAEKELARLEGLIPLETQRQEGQRAVGLAKADMKTAALELASARKAWCSALRQAGLPEDLRPRQVREFYRSARQHAATAARLEEVRRELSERRREQAMLAGRVAQVTADVGLPAVSSDPLGQLRHLLGALAEQQSRLTARAGLRKQLARLVRQMRATKLVIRKYRRRRDALLDHVGAGNEQELRQLAERQAELDSVTRERDQRSSEIRATLAGHTTEDAIGKYLAAGPLDGRGQAIRDEVAAAQAQLEDRREQRGRVSEQMRQLGDDRRLSLRQVELASVEERLREAVRRWQVLATASLVLDQVRETYERDHQPLALREASKYLCALSGGRYRRVWAPLGQENLKVDDGDGKSLDVELLSRGTREQLFLSLRLALVSAYARRGIELPLVLDDVLVNFDDARAKAAAGALRDFARAGHQMLIFTCHEHIAKLFRSLHVDVRQLPAEYQGVTLLREIEEEPKSRRRRAVAAPAATSEENSEAPQPVADHDSTFAAPEPTAAASAPSHDLPATATEPSAPGGPKRRRQRTSVRARGSVEQVPWSAEEFEGELADRVRRVDTYEVDEVNDVSDAGPQANHSGVAMDTPSYRTGDDAAA